jgi:hypothetical protein
MRRIAFQWRCSTGVIDSRLPLFSTSMSASWGFSRNRANVMSGIRRNAWMSTSSQRGVSRFDDGSQ